MRALSLLAALSLVAGCGKTRTCRLGTVLLQLHLDASVVAADSLTIEVSIDGVAGTPHSRPHQPGAAEGSIEIDFVSYPRGSLAEVTVSAMAGGTLLGARSGSVRLSDACGLLPLTIGFGTDDGGSDLSAASSDDLSIPDLAGGDAATTDAATDLASIDLSHGQGCDGGSQCTSGFCSLNGAGENVCCNLDCLGACVAAARCMGGTCQVAAQGTACGNYACDGVSPSCPLSCTSNVQCASGSCCNGLLVCGAIGSDNHCGAGCVDCNLQPVGQNHCLGGACGCTSDNECAANLYCESSTHTCTMCGIGADCTGHCASQCGSGGYCNGTQCVACINASHCGPACDDCAGNPAGKQCVSGASCGCLVSSDCPGGNYCASGNTCMPQLSVNQSCNAHDCASTDPNCPECATAFSAAPCPPGGKCPRCLVDADCISGDYCRSSLNCLSRISSGIACNDSNCAVPGCLQCNSTPSPSPCPVSNVCP